MTFKISARIIFIPALLFFAHVLKGQPFFNTEVPNRYADENVFRQYPADTSALPAFSDLKDSLPEISWPARPDIISLYWRTWELAFANLHRPGKENGFITPYTDPAFNGNIFTEDFGFMALYCRYAFRAFQFQNALDNFYAKQHKDGFICREIWGTTGSDAFERFDPSSAGINLFPWAEWEYFCNTGDRERLGSVFPVLLANYQWYSAYRTWPDGSYFSSGWGCGMDNQPRLPKGFNPAFSHGHMSWVDATLQQIAAGKQIVKMAEVLGRTADVTKIMNEISTLTEYVNTKMWNDEKGLYVDRYRDGSLSGVKSIGTYWALLAGIVPEERKARFIAHLSDSTEFARPHRIPTLSADNPDYDPQGGYWRGAVWAMSDYMVLRGLTTAGADSLAYEIAMNHVDNVVRIFNHTGVIWENYAPEFSKGSGKVDFVGEGGLTGTAILLEYVFGIRADVPKDILVWDIRLTDEFGVKKYPYGKNGWVSLQCRKRKSRNEEPVIRVQSNVSLNLKVIWDGGSRMMQVGGTAK